MSRLFVAEKPSLGRAIAAALPRPHKNEQGYITCGNGDIVTWCIGHLLEQVEPDVYDQRYKKWNIADLPIIPQTWQLRPRKSAAKQLAVVKKLLKSAQHIIHAGDPDREGQLLVDEVLDYCRLSAAKKASAERILISDLNVSAVKRSLQSMRLNKEFVPLSVSALARSRADWLYGMNMSRAYTLLGNKAGYQGVLSVGRVQTPVLGLVVRRDLEIEHFIPKDYFILDALIPYQQDSQSQDIKARWVPSEACSSWLDEDKRVLSRALVENVAGRIKGQTARVTKSEQKNTKQSAPLPYSLSALQIDASKRFGMSAQQALDLCQSLYEKYKAITYPRSDCRYLPKDHFIEGPKIAQAIKGNVHSLEPAVSGADFSIRSKAWNDAKVDAHHAIIPTAKSVPNLPPLESKVYQLIATQYLMQFYPPAEYAESKLEFDINGGKFVASGRQLKKPGWRVLTSQAKEKSASDMPFVPALQQGQELICREGEIKQKQTEPPKHFTEATLLQAMTGIARFVQDISLKKILRDTDGLGTEATRAGILDTLFKRALLSRTGKSVISTSAGRGLVAALPDLSTYPDLTAQWEKQLLDMTEKKQSYSPFMVDLQFQVTQLVDQARTSPVPESLRSLPAVKKPAYKKRRPSSTSSKNKRATTKKRD